MLSSTNDLELYSRSNLTYIYIYIYELYDFSLCIQKYRLNKNTKLLNITRYTKLNEIVFEMINNINYYILKINYIPIFPNIPDDILCEKFADFFLQNT